MVVELILNSIFEGLATWSGSYIFVCILIMAIIVLGLVFAGLEFDFALLCASPLPYTFAKGGYIDNWISGVMIVIVLGVSIYLIWIRWNNKY